MGIKVRTEDYTEGYKRRKSNSSYEKEASENKESSFSSGKNNALWYEEGAKRRKTNATSVNTEEKETAEEKSPWKRSYSDVFNVPVTKEKNADEKVIKTKASGTVTKFDNKTTSHSPVNFNEPLSANKSMGYFVEKKKAEDKEKTQKETKKEQDITYIPSEKGFEEKYAGLNHEGYRNASSKLWEEYAVTGNTDLLEEYEYLKGKGYETSNEKVLRWKADNAGEKADEAWRYVRHYSGNGIATPNSVKLGVSAGTVQARLNAARSFSEEQNYWKGLADEAKQREFIAEFETPAKEDPAYLRIIADKRKRLMDSGSYFGTPDDVWVLDIINGHADINNVIADVSLASYSTDTSYYEEWAERIAEMTEEEKNIFRYYALLSPKENTGGYSKCTLYLRALEPELNKRIYEKETEKAREKAIKNPFGANAETVVSNLVNAPKAFGTFLTESVGEERFDPYALGFKSQYTSEAVRGTTSENIENPFWNFVYNTGMSIADSAAVMPMGGAGVAFLGMNAAVSEGRKTAIDGGSNSQILIKGISAGIFEAAFEKIGIDNLFKSKVVESLTDVFMTILKQGGIEASEEFCTSLANIVTDNVTMGGESQFNKLVRGYMSEGFSYEEASGMAYVDMAGEVGMETLSGFVSGLFFGGADASIQYNSNTSVGKAITEGGKANELIEYAKSMPKETETRQKVNKLVEKAESGQKVTNADVGELAVTMFEEGTIDAESYNWLLGISETETVQQTSPEGAKTTYSDNTNGKSEVQEQVEMTGKMTFGDYYSNVVRKPYSAKASSRVRNMSATERIFAKAGAKAEDISVAASQAKGMQYDGEKEVEAYEYGLEQRKNGNGQDLELLIEATDYLDSIGESGIMKGEERQSSKEIPSIEYLEKNAREIAKRSPVEIPENATYDIQEKNGYNQIKYTWERDGYKYTSRWHTRTPGAPKEQGISWVVERRIPGIGYGENHRGAVKEVLVGKNLWIAKSEWRKAINARHNGTATKQQKEWLDNGHRKDE